MYNVCTDFWSLNDSRIKDLYDYAIKTQDNCYSLCTLGELYERGLGVKKDSRKAEEYYIEASKKGNPRSCYRLGEMHRLGIYRSKSIVCSEKWYHKAIKIFEEQARCGEAEAMYFYGLMIMNGCGIVKDWDKGIILVKRAAGVDFEAAILFLKNLKANVS